MWHFVDKRCSNIPLTTSYRQFEKICLPYFKIFGHSVNKLLCLMLSVHGFQYYKVSFEQKRYFVPSVKPKV